MNLWLFCFAVALATLPPDPKPKLRSPKDTEFRRSLAPAAPQPKKYYLGWTYPVPLTNGLAFEVQTLGSLSSTNWRTWVLIATNRVLMPTTNSQGWFRVRAYTWSAGTTNYSEWAKK